MKLKGNSGGLVSQPRDIKFYLQINILITIFYPRPCLHGLGIAEARVVRPSVRLCVRLSINLVYKITQVLLYLESPNFHRLCVILVSPTSYDLSDLDLFL